MGYFTAILLTISGGSVVAAAGLWVRATAFRRLTAASMVAVVALAVPIAWNFHAGPASVGVAVAAVAAGTALLMRYLRRLHPVGRLSRSLDALFRLAVPLWWGAYALVIPAGLTVRLLVGTVAAVQLLCAPWQIIDEYLFSEVLCRREWSRPRRLAPGLARTAGRRISVHVPCYAEPPEVVCRTLSALSRQRYADFEVLVIDNNTEDERLWRPVEEHCRRLGPRFRFLHVNPLAGAKAGALNLALRESDPDAELIAVLDCDYEASPDFLSALAGYFDDERIAFVQTAHDYRDWAGNAYQGGCYEEYRAPYATYMVSRNEWGVPLIVGTMCVIRREALRRVGGWSPSCSTEDSELAIRLHAAGYQGRYFFTTFGRGLIPETFTAYRRQRSRWIGGPVQELLEHWRLYLPRRWAKPSALTPTQKLLLAHHGMRELATGVRAVLATAVGLAVLVLALTGPPPDGFPAGAAVAMLMGTGAGVAVRWLRQRYAAGSSPRAALGALLSFAALAGVGRLAALRSLLRVTRPWGRTHKFPATASRWLGAVRSTRPEIVAGAFWLSVATVVGIAWLPSALGLLLVLYLSGHGLACLAAPALALYAERHLRLGRHRPLQTVPALAELPQPVSAGLPEP